VADEAEKPKNDEDDYYGPEHGYAFPLSWFKRHIPTKSRETIKQKLYRQGGDQPPCWQAVTNPARSMDRIDTRSALFGRNNFSNVFDLLLDFVYLRMHVTNQIVLRLRKLFNARCHFMQLFQRRLLTG
jgi:hypothetical protein